MIADRYELVRALDSGAMGEVFERMHRALHRRVALKVLRPELGVSDETMERFSREAQAAAAIGHPNIVDVIDLGIHDDRPFLVMELLEGESLLPPPTAHIRVADLPPGAVVRVDGVAQAGSCFEVPRGAGPVAVEVSQGSSVRGLTLVPDRDQTLVFGPVAAPAVEAAPPPAPPRSRRRSHRRSRR